MKQSTITYNKDNLTITIEGMDEVEKALEDLKRKTPAAAKVAINATAREARKLMIAQAKARYAVNAKGAQHLKDLKTSGKKGHNATNTNLEAVLFIAKPRADLAYFQHRPTQSFSGRAVLHNAPEYVQARILKSSSMRKLGAEDIEVRGRSIGPAARAFWWSSATATWAWCSGSWGPAPATGTTAKGRPRWTNRSGQVEKLITMGRAVGGGHAQHGVAPGGGGRGGLPAGAAGGADREGDRPGQGEEGVRHEGLPKRGGSGRDRSDAAAVPGRCWWKCWRSCSRERSTPARRGASP